MYFIWTYVSSYLYSPKIGDGKPYRTSICIYIQTTFSARRTVMLKLRTHNIIWLRADGYFKKKIKFNSQIFATVTWTNKSKLLTLLLTRVGVWDYLLISSIFILCSSSRFFSLSWFFLSFSNNSLFFFSWISCSKNQTGFIEAKIFQIQNYNRIIAEQNPWHYPEPAQNLGYYICKSSSTCILCVHKQHILWCVCTSRLTWTLTAQQCDKYQNSSAGSNVKFPWHIDHRLIWAFNA